MDLIWNGAAKKEQAARWQMARHTSFSVATFLVIFHMIKEIAGQKKIQAVKLQGMKFQGWVYKQWPEMRGQAR